MPRTPSSLIALGVAVVLVACGSDDGAGAGDAAGGVTPAPSTSAPAATSSTSAAGGGTTTTTAAPAEPEVRVVALRYAGGEVVGGRARVAVGAGERVRLEVTSDVAEEVHVHGYDLEVPVAAASTTAIDLVGDLPGVWEVELHGTGDVLVELEVAG